MYDYLFLIRRMGSSESGRLMITPVTVTPVVSSALVWPAMVTADAPGRSPDGLAIASPLVAAVSSLCWFFLQFLLSLVFSLFVCLFPFPAAGVPRRFWDLVERKSPARGLVPH